MLIVFGITGEHGHFCIPDDCESLPHEAQAFDVSFAGQIALQLPFVPVTSLLVASLSTNNSFLHFFTVIWSHWVWLFEIMFQVLVLNWHFHFYRDLIWLIMFVLAFSLTSFVQPLFLCPNKNSSIWPNSVCPSMWEKTALASAQDIWPCNARHAEYKGKGGVQYEEENTLADWGWSWSIPQSQTLSW